MPRPRDVPSNRRVHAVSPVRALTLTGGLALAGAVAGGTTSALFVLAYGAVSGQLTRDIGTYWVPAVIGAILGMVVGPVVAWGFLRAVPLGRAILGVSVGAALGAAAGLIVPGALGSLGVLLGAMVGSITAAMWLRFRST